MSETAVAGEDERRCRACAVQPGLDESEVPEDRHREELVGGVMQGLCWHCRHKLRHLMVRRKNPSYAALMAYFIRSIGGIPPEDIEFRGELGDRYDGSFLAHGVVVLKQREGQGEQEEA